MKNDERIFIFDTTLRDGQQSPGAGMSFADNLIYAQYADALGIDILEAGFPAASQHDFEIVQAISQKMTEQNSIMKIAALSQLREDQVIRSMQALAPSLKIGKARIHVYVPVDPNLMPASLGQLANDKPEIIRNVYRLIKMIAEAGFEIEFSPEGYSRMQENFNFTTDLILNAVAAGATTINCPDTIGGASRWQAKEDYFVTHMQRHAKIVQQEFPDKKIIWSVHCHNDLGCALDNSLNAVFDGPARQIEGCINGVGERAGNVPLEQCIMMLHLFGNKHSNCRFYTETKLEMLKTISDFINEKMLKRQPHWPVTGENAARHSAGGHTNAILKNPLAYQAFDPEIVGSSISFVFGPLSGSNHAREILEGNGFKCCRTEKAAVTQAIKNMYATRRKGITDDELIFGYQQYRSPIKILKIRKNEANSGHIITLEGKFFHQDIVHIDYPSDSNEKIALSALENEVKKYFSGVMLSEYRTQIASKQKVCIHRATVVVSNDQGNDYMGKASDENRLLSIVKAYIDAINQAYVHTFYKQAG